MRFLVQGTNIDAGYLLPPAQALQTIAQAVVPSFQQLAALEDQGTVHGGIVPGERTGAFIIDVDSYEALDALMNHLPFFGLVQWQVKPLLPFATIAQQLPRYLEDLRQQQPGAPGGDAES